MNVRMFYDKDVNKNEIQSVIDGVNFTVSHCIGLGEATVGDLVAVDERFSALFALESGQVNASEILNAMPDASNYESSIFVTSKDISVPGLNYILGASRIGKTVVSAARMDDLALEGCAAHETGHAYGLVSKTSSQYAHSSKFDGHCSNKSCLMHPINSAEEMHSAVANMYGKFVLHFCKFCRSDLKNIPINFFENHN